MNPLIKTQLENCRVANIPEFSNDDTNIIIPKGSDITISPYQVGRYYLIELSDYILHPPADFTLADNWNQGRVPTYKWYKVQVTQVMGKMVKVLGSGYDMISNQDAPTVWDGWIPQKGIKIIQELK